MQGFECAPFGEVFPVKITSPTCKDLGIPRESDDVIVPARLIKNPSLHLDGIRYEALVKNSMSPSDPFSPLCMIPLPSPFTLEHLEPTFIRKRNERERDRVRCVNDGYARLKEQLPLENKHKRISKVEILRRAIDYIKYLNAILETDNENGSDEHTHEQSAIENRDTEIRQPDNVNEEFPQNDTLAVCCQDLSPEQNTNYFTLDNLSDSDEIYGQGSDLGYESFTSGCEMEDDQTGSCDVDYSECSRGLKRPLEGVSAEDCSPCKQ